VAANNHVGDTDACRVEQVQRNSWFLLTRSVLFRDVAVVDGPIGDGHILCVGDVDAAGPSKNEGDALRRQNGESSSVQDEQVRLTEIIRAACDRDVSRAGSDGRVDFVLQLRRW
jgi:hypothetical protein